MKFSLRGTLLKFAILIGLGMSVVLLAEYQQPHPTLCAEGGGCSVVAQSAYSHIAGIPLPLLGAAYFALLLGLSAVRRAHWALVGLSLVGAITGLVLLALQAFVIQAFCRFCVVVDVAAVLIGIAALGPQEADLPPISLTRGVAHAAAALFVAAISWTWQAHSASAPTAVASVAPLTTGDPQRVTVLEFLDFECPACRAQYDEMAPVLSDYSDKLQVIVKHVPLPQHRHAVDAARAYCCAEEKGEAHDMADRLFRAEQLNPEDCEQIAVTLGLDLADFQRCVRSDRVTERLRADGEAAAAVGVRGLPTFWIGEERFEGVHEADSLRASIERALRQRAS